MSQQSQFSEGGFSDIISDVDTFIKENDITEDVGQLLQEIGKNGNSQEQRVNYCKEEDEEKYEPAPQGFFESSQFPPVQPINLSNDEYTGQLDFEVEITPNEQKTPWEYSSRLNKMFIGVNYKFPIAFRVKSRPRNIPLFIRVTPIFSQSQYFQEIVHRCVGHQHPQDPTNQEIEEHIFQHIIRCSNDEVKYFGNKDEKQRLNLVLPLKEPQAGTNLVREFFYFVCQNSCVLGMNRRPIEIVFTLEDVEGHVLGRKVVGARICSCPKRDKEKEERDLDKNSQAPQGKKRRADNMDDRENRGRLVPVLPDEAPDTRSFLFSMNIVGKNNYEKLLHFSQALMANEIVKLEGRNGADAPFRKCFNEISALMSRSNPE